MKELTPFERQALEHYRERREDLKEQMTAEEILAFVQGEFMSECIKVYKTAALPSLADYGVAFLSLPEEKQAEVRRLLGVNAEAPTG